MMSFKKSSSLTWGKYWRWKLCLEYFDTTAVQIYELFHINFTSFHCTGRYELNKLTSLPMCGFIAQLVEHRTGIAEVTGSNPVEALIFFRLLLSHCLDDVSEIFCLETHQQTNFSSRGDRELLFFVSANYIDQLFCVRGELWSICIPLRCIQKHSNS